mmetsp:Transcript_66891/g.193715  ORF Transcript_66891/g.193715 Transcript_66891/m.193715 type:complete len:540 (+) Transcript_66891:601-2220(+)
MAENVDDLVRVELGDQRLEALVLRPALAAQIALVEIIGKLAKIVVFPIATMLGCPPMYAEETLVERLPSIRTRCAHDMVRLAPPPHCLVHRILRLIVRLVALLLRLRRRVGKHGLHRLLHAREVALLHACLKLAVGSCGIQDVVNVAMLLAVPFGLMPRAFLVACVLDLKPRQGGDIGDNAGEALLLNARNPLLLLPLDATVELIVSTIARCLHDHVELALPFALLPVLLGRVLAKSALLLDGVLALRLIHGGSHRLETPVEALVETSFEVLPTLRSGDAQETHPQALPPAIVGELSIQLALLAAVEEVVDLLLVDGGPYGRDTHLLQALGFPPDSVYPTFTNAVRNLALAGRVLMSSVHALLLLHVPLGARGTQDHIHLAGPLALRILHVLTLFLGHGALVLRELGAHILNALLVALPNALVELCVVLGTGGHHETVELALLPAALGVVLVLAMFALRFDADGLLHTDLGNDYVEACLQDAGARGLPGGQPSVAGDRGASDSERHLPRSDRLLPRGPKRSRCPKASARGRAQARSRRR